MAVANAHKQRGQKNREALITASSEVFSEHGFVGSSLAMIAAKVGITQAGLLHHFGTKENLIQQVVDVFQAAQIARLQALDETSGFATAHHFAAMAVADNGDTARTKMHVALLREGRLGDPIARQYADDYSAAVREKIASGIRRGVTRGSVRGDFDASGFAALLLVIADGAAMHSNDIDELTVMTALNESIALIEKAHSVR